MEGNHVLDPQAVQNFYYEAYQVMRNVTGIGEGNGPMIVRHFLKVVKISDDPISEYSRWLPLFHIMEQLHDGC